MEFHISKKSVRCALPKHGARALWSFGQMRQILVWTCPHCCDTFFNCSLKLFRERWNTDFCTENHFYTYFFIFLQKNKFCCIIWCWNSMISINHIKNGGKTCSIIVHYQNTPRIRVKRWWTWTKTFPNIIILVDIQSATHLSSLQSEYDWV